MRNESTLHIDVPYLNSVSTPSYLYFLSEITFVTIVGQVGVGNFVGQLVGQVHGLLSFVVGGLVVVLFVVTFVVGFAVV